MDPARTRIAPRRPVAPFPGALLPSAPSTTPPSAGRIAADGLRIRRWALLLLSGSTPGTGDQEGAARASLPSWRAFLTMERCALPLSRMAAFPEALAHLPSPVRALLDQQRMFELKRALSVRAHLQELAEASLREGWRVVVLKGGVPIASGWYLDVQDLDVLVAQEDIPAVTRFLEQMGAGHEGRWEAPVGSPGRFHLAPRRAAHALQVEVHYAVSRMGDPGPLLARSVELDDLPGLRRLAPADHLRHLLHHVAVHHPERSGSLRDAVLIRRALDAYAAEEAAAPGEMGGVPSTEVEGPGEPGGFPREINGVGGDGGRTAAPIRDLVAFARSLAADGGPTPRPPPADPFMAVAAAGYLALARASRGHDVTDLQASGTALLVQGTGPWVTWVRSVLNSPTRESGNARLRGLGERVPRLSALLRVTRRGLLLLASLPPSWSTARAARKLAGSFTSGPGHPPRD